MTTLRETLAGSEPVGRDLLAVDWGSTPLGEPESWPGSLQNAVRILVTSRFSMWMAWGPELTFFCNDAYRRDTLGKKYPWALGKPASAVWSEIWPDIGPRIDHVMTTGEATWDEKLMLFLERSGFVEETYHTFSYSPLTDDSGHIAGMLCVVKEDTEQVIAARRMATLRDLGSRTTGELTEAETIASSCQHLAANPKCLPFTAVYLFDEDGRTATRAGFTGFTGDHPAAPAVVAVDDGTAPWPAAEMLHGSSVLVNRLERFEDLPTGAWDVPPSGALVVPLAQVSQPVPYGFLVAALNPFRPDDESYRSFLRLVAGQIAAAITDARAYEFERERAESLARIDQAKTDFFTNVSHEFRTPLTLLLGPVEDALVDANEPLPPGQRRRVEVVQRNGERLLKLVNSLLDFSRLESGKVTSRFESVDLAVATSELAGLFQSAVEAAGLHLVVDCPPLPEKVYVDPDQWAKIVLNLVSNALKFTFDGQITVALHAADGEAVLTVADTGAGIPEHEMEHLFERFHRVHGARSRTHEGSGIGLALVSELAALHGGVASAESRLGEGSTFTVRVPFGKAHLPREQVVEAGHGVQARRQAGGFLAEAFRWLEAERSAPADRGEMPGVVAPDGKRATVLVVDDNPDMRQYVADLLSAEYDVHTASDGVEALDKVPSVRPDLVLTDVMMPNLDGFGLLQKLRADPATTTMPVVMLSARAGEEGTVEGLEAGADDYLTKPFSARELRARVRANIELDRQRQVRAVLERSQALLDQAERLASVGSWELDLETGDVLASDELLRLVGRSREEIERLGYPDVVDVVVHPDDRALVRASLDDPGEGVIAYEARIVLPGGGERLTSVRAEVVADDGGVPTVVRGSLQDVTSQREAEQALAAAAAREEAALREHAIADELQRSLIPEQSFELEHLDVATYYCSGVEGTQVGGDWYDIVELGAGRTAFVVGDVMGRGVKAASIMGQLRSAVRAFAQLDLPPTEVLEHLDRMVQSLGGDHIVTCVYAVFDSTDQTLRFANAGHLPPLLTESDGRVKRLTTAGPPLGAGYFGLPTEEVQLSLGGGVTFYTDGLVEHRGRDLDVGIEALAEQLRSHAGSPLASVPETLVRTMLPTGPSDDVAILMARVNAQPFEAAASHRLRGDETMVADARRLSADHLREWGVPEDTVSDVVLMVSELVTNAFVYGRPPFDLRLRRSAREVFVEVQDRAAYRPRRQRPTETDEHGRGLQIVSVLADGWGSRASGNGKCVWFTTAVEEAHGNDPVTRSGQGRTHV